MAHAAAAARDALVAGAGGLVGLAALFAMAVSANLGALALIAVLGAGADRLAATPAVRAAMQSAASAVAAHRPGAGAPIDFFVPRG